MKLLSGEIFVGLAKRKARPAKVRSLTLLLMLCSLARQIYDIDSKHQKRRRTW